MFSVIEIHKTNLLKKKTINKIKYYIKFKPIKVARV